MRGTWRFGDSPRGLPQTDDHRAKVTQPGFHHGHRNQDLGHSNATTRLGASEHHHTHTSSAHHRIRGSRAAGPGSKNPGAAQPRGRKAWPSDPPPTKRKSAPPEGCRALECSGRRGIRTPCGLPRVSRGRERSGAESGTRVAGRGRRGGPNVAATRRWEAGRASGGLGAAEGTRGNVAAHGAGGAGPAGGPGARPRVLPRAGTMLLARRRSCQGRLSLFQEGVTGVTGTGTGERGSGGHRLRCRPERLDEGKKARPAVCDKKLTWLAEVLQAVVGFIDIRQRPARVVTSVRQVVSNLKRVVDAFRIIRFDFCKGVTRFRQNLLRELLEIAALLDVPVPVSEKQYATKLLRRMRGNLRRKIFTELRRKTIHASHELLLNKALPARTRTQQKRLHQVALVLSITYNPFGRKDSRCEVRQPSKRVL